MAFTNQQIIDYLLANPELTDVQIRDAMKQFSITPAQMASAVGLSEGAILSRIAATIPYGSTFTIGDMIIAPQYRVTGSGETEEIGGLEGFYTSKTTGDPNYKAPVGSEYQQYAADGTFQRTGKTQKTADSFLGGLTEALKDPVVLAALAAVTAGSSGLFSGGGAATGASTAAGTGLGASTSLGTGLTTGASGLGLNAAGTAGLGTLGTGAGITAGAGLTGTGVLTGSTLGTGLLGTGTGLAGLTGTGVLSGSTLGTNLLGTTGTGALTGTGVLTGSGLGTTLLGTGANTAATVGGLTGLTNAANVGAGALTTGVTTGLTGLGTGALTTGVGTNLGSTVANTAGSTLANTAGSTVANTAATTLTATELANAAKLGLTAAQYAQLFTSTAQTAAGLLQQQTSREAAIKAQGMIDTETAAAKAGAQFRPIGMTTRFGSSQFVVDPLTGRLTSAGYTLSPEAKAAQDRFVKLAESGIQQAEGAQKAFEPLQTGAQSLFKLGAGYLAEKPETVAQNYLNQQMALLKPGRELELANLQNKLQQQGRGGLSVAQGGALGATTPELQALYNARATQEAQLAANAQQYGQQQVAFGAGLLGTGAQTMGQYYAGQQGAYAPYMSAMGQITGLESLGQQPFTMGTGLAQQTAQAGANVGQLGLRGAEQSVALATGRAATTNPYATLLGGAGASDAFGRVVGNLFGSTPTNALDFGSYGKGDAGFQKMLEDIYG